MNTEQLQKTVVDALEELKAEEIHVIDVRNSTTITDIMVVASGTSTRHVKSIADNLVMRVKQKQGEVLGIEGEEAAEWILVDCGDVVVHLMLPAVRDFYALEKLWTLEQSKANP